MPCFPRFPWGIHHRNCDRQEQRRFRLHPVLGIPGRRSLQQGFHPFPVFPDRNDERHPGFRQKPDHVPGVEFTVKAESFAREAEFSNPVKALSDIANLGGALTYRIDGQRQLPVFRGHIEGNVGVEVIRRLFALASDDIGFVLAGSFSVVGIIRVINCKLICVPRFEDVMQERGEDSGILLLQFVHSEFSEVISKRRFSRRPIQDLCE